MIYLSNRIARWKMYSRLVSGKGMPAVDREEGPAGHLSTGGQNERMNA